MYGKVNYPSQASSMDKPFEPDVKLLYRRPQSRDKYECVTDVLDDILIRLETFETKLSELENGLRKQ